MVKDLNLARGDEGECESRRKVDDNELSKNTIMSIFANTRDPF